MIDRQLIHSRTARTIFAAIIWASVATWGVYFYRQASKATEIQLAAAAARSDGLEAIMADDHFGVITCDGTGAVIDWNAGAERLTGVAEAEAMGRHVGELVCGELTERLGRAFSERTIDDNSARVHVVNCAMARSGVEVRCRIYAARSKNTGEILGVVLVDPRANVKIGGE